MPQEFTDINRGDSFMKSEFEHIVKSGDITFRYSNGRSIEEGREFHDYHEILYIENAGGNFVSENEDIPLSSGMLIIIPKETFHTFRFDEGVEYKRSCLNFYDNDELSKTAAYFLGGISISKKPSPAIISIFDEITRVFDKGFTQNEKRLLLYAEYIRLMIAIKQSYECFFKPNERRDDSIVYKTLAYINKNYRKSITIDSMADELYVSKSTLSHRFSEELGISVHKYIQSRRLLYANQLIKGGIPTQNACLDAGFNNYSAFYRAYKKYYKKSPSKN